MAPPGPPAWVTRPFDECKECHRVAERKLGYDGERNHGAFRVLAWLTIGERSPMTERTFRDATWEVARSESWVALCVAAGQPLPTVRDWERLGVEPRPVLVDDREFAYGAWRAFAWLLNVRDDWPVHTSWQINAEIPPEQPHLYVPWSERDSDAWRTAERACRDRAEQDALCHWRHIRQLADATAPRSH